jgi:hypothetical protein
MTNVDAFASALKKGLGRAMILLRQDPLNPAYRGALLHACMTNQVFDVQCEEPRAPYLCKLVHEIGAERDSWEALCLEFADPGDDPSGRHRTQMFAILCLIAGADRSLDRSRLRTMLSATDYDLVARNCMDDLVRLEGLSGLEFCVKTFEAKMHEADDEWLLGTLVHTLQERDGAEAADTQIRQAREQSADFDQHMRIVDAENLAGKLEVPPFDREAFKSMLATNQAIPFPWIEAATNQDITWVVDALHDATSGHELGQLLRFFWKHDFPGAPDFLISIARRPDARVANFALKALSRIRHPDVRSFAMELMKERQRVSDGIRLLARNWQADDLSKLEAALASVGDDEHEIHDITSHMPEVLDSVPPGTCSPASLLLEVYERNPCTTCRIDVMEALVHHGCVPEWLAEECQYDAEPRVIALVSKS